MGRGVNECFAVSLCESLDVLDDNASDCRLGIPPRQPGLFTVHPSLFEPSLCPPGRRRVLRADRAVGPPRRRARGVGGGQGGYAETVLDRWREALVSGLEPTQIVGRYVASPLDIERRMPSMRHGDWNHGEMTQDQLGVFRPFHEYPPYRTAFENVYLCGSSTHPAARSAAPAGTTRPGPSPRSSGSTPGGARRRRLAESSSRRSS